MTLQAQAAYVRPWLRYTGLSWYRLKLLKANRFCAHVSTALAVWTPFVSFLFFVVFHVYLYSLCWFKCCLCMYIFAFDRWSIKYIYIFTISNVYIQSLLSVILTFVPRQHVFKLNKHGNVNKSPPISIYFLIVVVENKYSFGKSKHLWAHELTRSNGWWAQKLISFRECSSNN